ncbi:MAG: 4Fe-4S dicluster domain-containing protein [Eubacteriaceae bacterium]
MKKQLGTFVSGDSSKCTGCKACEIACFVVHSQKDNPIGKTVGTVTTPVTPRLFVTKFSDSAMPIQCKHCEDAPCLNACTKKAVFREDGHIIVKEELCIGCKDCMMACPFGAVTLLPVARGGKIVMQASEDEEQKSAFKCDFCIGLEKGPACIDVCPHQALEIVSPEEDRVEKNIKAAMALAFTKSY